MKPVYPFAHPSDIQMIRLHISEWAARTFPNRTPQQALNKLGMQEIPEMLVEFKNSPPGDPRPDLAGEWADVMILMLDLATLWKIDPVQAIWDKMDVNVRRMWGQGPDGTFSHIELKPAITPLSKEICPVEDCINNCIEGGAYCSYHMRQEETTSGH